MIGCSLEQEVRQMVRSVTRLIVSKRLLSSEEMQEQLTKLQQIEGGPHANKFTYYYASYLVSQCTAAADLQRIIVHMLKLTWSDENGHQLGTLIKDDLQLVRQKLDDWRLILTRMRKGKSRVDIDWQMIQQDMKYLFILLCAESVQELDDPLTPVFEMYALTDGDIVKTKLLTLALQMLRVAYI